MKFIVDNNVGKLAGWLRALGYDTLFINPVDDGDLVRIAQQEGRTVLTRDRGLLRRRPIASGEVLALEIRGDDWRDQLAQVVGAFGLRTEPSFTRCIECNTPLRRQTRDDARQHVPPYVYRTQQTFLVCPSCGRHYWQGTHWQRMNQVLGELLRLQT